MSVASELAAALVARDAGTPAEAARLLRPLAEAGDVEAQVHLACLMLDGSHRFATFQDWYAWRSKASDTDDAAFMRELQPDVEQALAWLQNASDQGIGPASHNLAMAYLGGAGDLPPDERRAKVKALLAKAREQGFGVFGREDQVEGYLRMLEGYAADRGIPMPWETRSR